MTKGKRILCKNVKALADGTSYYVSFKVAYSHAKWVENDAKL